MREVLRHHLIVWPNFEHNTSKVTTKHEPCSVSSFIHVSITAFSLNMPCMKAVLEINKPPLSALNIYTYMLVKQASFKNLFIR